MGICISNVARYLWREQPEALSLSISRVVVAHLRSRRRRRWRRDDPTFYVAVLKLYTSITYLLKACVSSCITRRCKTANPASPQPQNADLERKKKDVDIEYLFGLMFPVGCWSYVPFLLTAATAVGCHLIVGNYWKVGM